MASKAVRKRRNEPTVAGHGQAAATDQARGRRPALAVVAQRALAQSPSTRALRRFRTCGPRKTAKGFACTLEPVSEEEGMSVWSYTNPIDYAATLMILLANAEDEFPDFDPERPPKTPMSPPPAVGSSKGHSRTMPCTGSSAIRE